MSIITVWGAPQCGKTEVAIALAKMLARRGQVVCLISAEHFAEMYGRMEVTDVDGRGILNAINSASSSGVSKNAIPLKEKGLFLLAPTPFDSGLDLICTKDQARRILTSADGLFATVVVDCTSQIDNAITGEALAMSKNVIIPVAGNATNKTWHDAYEFYLCKIIQKAVYLQNSTNKKFDYLTLMRLIGCKPVCTVPHCGNLHELAANSMGLMEAGNGYREAINQLAREVCK